MGGDLRRIKRGAGVAGVIRAAGRGTRICNLQSLTDANPIADLGAGAVIIQGFSAVFPLVWRMDCGTLYSRWRPRHRLVARFLRLVRRTVAGVLFFFNRCGWALGDLSKIVGGGLSLAGKPAAALAGGAADLAKDAVRQSGDTLTSFIDEAVSNRPADSTKNLSIRAKREVGLAIARLFNPARQANLRADRAAVVKALVIMPV